MGFRDLIFGKEEEEEEPTSKERTEVPSVRVEEPVAPPKPQAKPVQPQPPVMPPVSPDSPELEAELKELKNLMQQEKKDKGLGLEYYGFLKALGEEDDDEAHQRTLRSVNAVREQFSIGEALTWRSLVESAKTCMSWLSSHSRDKVAKLQVDHRTVSANNALQIEKAAMAIQENEEKIMRLQKEIEEQKKLQAAAKAAQEKADLAYEKRKIAIDNASVQLATEIANDIAVFQRQQ